MNEINKIKEIEHAYQIADDYYYNEKWTESEYNE